MIELRKAGRIQALDLLVDLTVTPYRNANTMHDRAAQGIGLVDSLDRTLTAGRRFFKKPGGTSPR